MTMIPIRSESMSRSWLRPASTLEEQPQRSVAADDERPVAADELPVVARLVVEIRSDGTRTVARGAMEDPQGQRVAVQAEGTTPLALARALARALWSMPRLPRPSLRALLAGRRAGNGRERG